MSSPDVSIDALTPRAKAMADLVLRQFGSREVQPRIAQAVHGLPLFGGLNAEQSNYKNLAVGIGEKLKRTVDTLAFPMP
jgi:hypothetical protein